MAMFAFTGWYFGRWLCVYVCTNSLLGWILPISKRITTHTSIHTSWRHLAHVHSTLHGHMFRAQQVTMTRAFPTYMRNIAQSWVDAICIYIVAQWNGLKNTFYTHTHTHTHTLTNLSGVCMPIHEEPQKHISHTHIHRHESFRCSHANPWRDHKNTFPKHTQTHTQTHEFFRCSYANP